MSQLQEKIDALSTALAELVKEVVVSTVKVSGKTAAAEPAAEEAAAPPKQRVRGKAAKAKPTVTLEEVRGAMIALAEAKDKQAVVEVLSRFGVAKIGDLKEENYAECKELAEAEAAAEEPEAEEENEDDPFAE